MPTASASVSTPIDRHRLDDGGLAGVGGRHEQLAGCRASAAAIAIDRAPLIGRTLPSRASSPTDGEVLQLLGQQLPGGDQQAQGDRQIEAAGVLAQIGRGQVDDGAAGVAAVAEVGQGPLDAVDALLDRHLRQADEDRLGQAGRGIDLDLDGHGVDADEGEGVELGEHARAIPEPL